MAEKAGLLKEFVFKPVRYDVYRAKNYFNSFDDEKTAIFYASLNYQKEARIIVDTTCNQIIFEAGPCFKLMELKQERKFPIERSNKVLFAHIRDKVVKILANKYYTGVFT